MNFVCTTVAHLPPRAEATCIAYYIRQQLAATRSFRLLSTKWIRPWTQQQGFSRITIPPSPPSLWGGVLQPQLHQLLVKLCHGDNTDAAGDDADAAD